MTVEEVFVLRVCRSSTLFQIEGSEIWIPNSQIEEPDVDALRSACHDRPEDTIEIEVSDWIAERKGIA